MSSTSTRELNKQGRYRGGSPRAAAILALAACGIATNVQAAPPVFTGPLPYQSIADSPFFADGQTCYALETFPDGVQSQPSFQFNSQTGAEIVPGVGVPPGGHVLQANSLGMTQLSFDTPVFEVGFVWTGGDPIGSTITMTVISGTEAISQQYASLSPNDPDNPDDNRFFGVSWDVGIQQLRITFLPFGPGIPNQIDDIQFDLSPQVVAIDPLSAAFDATGGSGSFSVTMNGPACGWSASTGDPWITLTTDTGTGDGSVQFTVAENLGADIRTGTIAVGSFSFTVNQSSASCEVTGISPTEATVAAAGASGSFDVAVTAPACTWSATTSDAWITLTTASGTGDGPVQFSVAENTSADPRSGSIAVGGFTFAVNQEPAACQVLGITPSSTSLPESGGLGSFDVTVNGTTCPWSATTGDPWITLTTDTGTGDGSVQFTVAENTSADPRSGTIAVDGFNFAVIQEPAACAVGSTDSDGDGVPDCFDDCPLDPDKIEPGVCGCGTAEDDSDGDGVPDCIDPCSGDGDYESPTQSPFGSDHALEHTFQGLAEPLSDGTLEIEVRADLGSFSEFVTVYFEGESLGLFFTVDGADCPKKAGVVTIPIAQSSLEAAIADGGVEVRVVASPLVGAGDCPTSLARVRLLYATSFPDCDGNGSDDGCDIEDGVVRDCNENLIPDSCDLANGLLVDCDGNGLVDLCEILDDPSLDENSDGSLDMCSYAYGDFDLDGSIGGADLAYLLSIWGLSNIPIGDLTGDGSIGGADLAALLSRWGTSPP